jgi:hypothetical protein
MAINLSGLKIFLGGASFDIFHFGAPIRRIPALTYSQTFMIEASSLGNGLIYRL